MEDNTLQWFKTETREDKIFVFDPLRKKYVLLTPEEEVRQKALYFWWSSYMCQLDGLRWNILSR